MNGLAWIGMKADSGLDVVTSAPTIFIRLDDQIRAGLREIFLGCIYVDGHQTTKCVCQINFNAGWLACAKESFVLEN